MNETEANNRLAYLDLCKKVFDLDKESLDYIEKRTSEEYVPCQEILNLAKARDAKIEDQRIKFDIDFSIPEVQEVFEENDQAYSMFKQLFYHAVRYMKSEYNVEITYNDFINNKIIWNKNQTKIKKVLEIIYGQNNSVYREDASRDYRKEDCADWIVKQFERIGASKKSARKLQLVISYNVMDWLLASTGEDWSSCFNLDNSGGGYQYCLGLPFLCGDKNRVLLYITDGAKKEFMGITTDKIKTRTWAILDKSGSFGIVKWYPNDTIGVDPVNAIIGSKSFMNKSRFNEGKYPLDVISTVKGAVIGVYSDMGSWEVVDDKLCHVGNGKEGQQIFSKNLVSIRQKKTTINFNRSTSEFSRSLGTNVNSGFRIKEWRRLGIGVDNFFDQFRCSVCDEKKIGVSQRDGDFYCFDCYKEKVFCCYGCNEVKIASAKYEVIDVTGSKKFICKDCYDTMSHKTCTCCGKYSNNRLAPVGDEPGTKICEVCLSKNTKYSTCEKCRGTFKHIKMVYNNFLKETHKLCNNCNSNRETFTETLVFNKSFREIIRDKGASTRNE